MEGQFSDLWLLDEMAITFHPWIRLDTTAWQLVYPPDPMRFAILLPSGNLSMCHIAFGDQPTPYLQLASGASQSTFVLNRFQVGTLITLPVRALTPTAAANIQPVSISFNPDRYRRYLDYVDTIVPKFRTL